MIPLAQNPTVVIQRNILGQIVVIASNVASDLKVVIVENDTDFNQEAVNKSFNTRRPVQPEQVLAAKKKNSL